MNGGLIATFLATLFSWFASAFQKKVATTYPDNHLALTFQYFAVASMIILLGVVWTFWQWGTLIPSLSWGELCAVVCVGVVGYIGALLLYKAYDHMPTGIALVIANTTTFMMYFINLWLFPWVESLSLPKILIAVIFFGIIVLFLLDQDKNKPTNKSLPETNKKSMRMYMVYPLGTAVCWSIYFVANSYFIKSDIMSPIQTGMATEIVVFLVAVVWLFMYRNLHTKNRKESLRTSFPHGKIAWFLVLIGLFMALNTYLTYYGYQTNPANVINVVKLFTVPVGALGARMLFKDTLSKKQTILLVIAVVLMVGFVVV